MEQRIKITDKDMKMKRKVLILALLAGIVFSVFGQTEADFVIEVNDDGQITLTGYNGTSANVVIPDEINGMPVVEIGSAVFERKQLTNVIIGNNVIRIGSEAFASNQLISVIIPDSVTVIGIAAFINNQLTSVTIGNSVTSIGNYAFSQNQLTSVTIPNSVTYLGDSVFYGNQLISITIGANVAFDQYLGAVFTDDFDDFYYDGGRQAGTYTRADTSLTTWVRR